MVTMKLIISLLLASTKFQWLYSWEISACTKYKFDLFCYYLNARYAQAQGDPFYKDVVVKDIMDFVIQAYAKCNPCDSCIECAQYDKLSLQCIQETLYEGLRKNSSRMLHGKIKLDHEVAGNYLSDFLETQLALHPICFCEECGNACDYLDASVVNSPKGKASTLSPDFQMLQGWNSV
ncbi:hypothetical protein WDU94_014856 [Cyamophila willieti]